MKKLMIAIAFIAVVAVAAIFGAKYYVQSTRPDLNANERIVSTALTQDGEPKDVLGQLPDVKIAKDLGTIYLSIPVNKKSMEKCKAALEGPDQQVEQCELSVSKAGYVTYRLDHMEKLKSGRYAFSFYDSKGELNVYASLELR